MSEGWRNWGLRLLALGIAIGIWFNASVQDRLVFSEKVVEAQVTYNYPRGFVIISPVQSVNVRLNGSKKAIRQLNPYMVSVQAELSRSQVGPANITLTADNVSVPDGLDVVTIEPNTIRVDLEKEVTQRVPVIPNLVGEPAAGSTAQAPEVLPAQVQVVGPEPVLSRLDSLSTGPVSLEGHSVTFEETASVLAPDPLIQIVQPTQVTVRVPIQPTPSRPDTVKKTPKPREKRKT
ncbi:MAG TPA: CdaR family protein [Thermoanaerobaculia bacterium]